MITVTGTSTIAGNYLYVDGQNALANATVNVMGSNTGTTAHGAAPLQFGTGSVTLGG